MELGWGDVLRRVGGGGGSTSRRAAERHLSGEPYASLKEDSPLDWLVADVQALSRWKWISWSRR